MLTQDRETAEEMAGGDICIYSFSRTYAEMMPAQEFMGHMDRAIRMVGETAGKDLLSRADGDIIEPRGRVSRLLMTVNL